VIATTLAVTSFVNTISSTGSFPCIVAKNLIASFNAASLVFIAEAVLESTSAVNIKVAIT